MDVNTEKPGRNAGFFCILVEVFSNGCSYLVRKPMSCRKDRDRFCPIRDTVVPKMKEKQRF